MKNSSPLSNISVASPCVADWNSMVGDEKIRHCEHCRMNVYNLSAMSAQEASDLVSQKSGRLCVRFYRRSDGTVLTQDCPVGRRTFREKVARRWLALSACIVTLMTGLMGCKKEETALMGKPQTPPVSHKNVTMGEVEAPRQVSPPAYGGREVGTNENFTMGDVCVTVPATPVSGSGKK